MISRFYLKENLSFQEIDLEFNNGLIVFTGPSGAGKSILMESLLSLFGLKDARASMSEACIENSNISNELYAIENDDDIIIKQLKKDKIRYFLNNQTVSKKNLLDFSKSLVKHIHVKDNSDFDSPKLIHFLDALALKTKNEFKDILINFNEVYTSLNDVERELNKLKSDETKLEELKAFAQYEISKIEEINPKADEYEELNEIKKTLSRKDKIEEIMELAKPIFDYQASVCKTLDLMEKDSSSFDEAMNEVSSVFEGFSDSLYELEDLDIEEVLTRIEALSSLQKRFGSIIAALEYKEEKKRELDSYENISFEKSILEKKQKELSEKINLLSNEISTYRKEAALLLEEKINHYLEFLYLSNARIHFHTKELDSTGVDKIVFELNGVNLETISSGEFNRLRLALLTSISQYEIKANGVLFLDEIDANLSGKESGAIATVLKELSKTYQIFAISHQPQLTATATQHFLVDKHDGVSTVHSLDEEGKVNEISRMISGENISEEAYSFAKNLLDSN